MQDIYDTLYVQRGVEEAFRIAADDARKLRAKVKQLQEDNRDYEMEVAKLHLRIHDLKHGHDD